MNRSTHPGSEAFEFIQFFDIVYYSIKCLPVWRLTQLFHLCEFVLDFQWILNSAAVLQFDLCVVYLLLMEFESIWWCIFTCFFLYMLKFSLPKWFIFVIHSLIRIFGIIFVCFSCFFNQIDDTYFSIGFPSIITNNIEKSTIFVCNQKFSWFCLLLSPNLCEFFCLFKSKNYVQTYVHYSIYF